MGQTCFSDDMMAEAQQSAACSHQASQAAMELPAAVVHMQMKALQLYTHTSSWRVPWVHV